MLFPGSPPPASWPGHGSIQRVDIASGKVETLYEESDDADGETRPLRAPNDIVFDDAGGFWFTDHGVRGDRTQRPHRHLLREGRRQLDHGGDLPGRCAERHRAVTERRPPLRRGDAHGPRSGRGTSRRPAPWKARTRSGPDGGELLVGPAGLPVLRLARGRRRRLGVRRHARQRRHHLDLAGRQHVEHMATDDPLTTNICFGGTDLRTAYITCSGSGRLLATEWPRPGCSSPTTREPRRSGVAVARAREPGRHLREPDRRARGRRPRRGGTQGRAEPGDRSRRAGRARGSRPDRGGSRTSG